MTALTGLVALATTAELFVFAAPGDSGDGGGDGGGHTMQGVGGQYRHGTGAVATWGVHAVTTVQGQPWLPGAQATPAEVKQAGALQLLPMVATQYWVPGAVEQLTWAMFCSCTSGLPTDGMVAPVALGNTELHVP